VKSGDVHSTAAQRRVGRHTVSRRADMLRRRARSPRVDRATSCRMRSSPPRGRRSPGPVFRNEAPMTCQVISGCCWSSR
jgi:hypothetical protein